MEIAPGRSVERSLSFRGLSDSGLVNLKFSIFWELRWVHYNGYTTGEFANSKLECIFSFTAS